MCVHNRHPSQYGRRQETGKIEPPKNSYKNTTKINNRKAKELEDEETEVRKCDENPTAKGRANEEMIVNMCPIEMALQNKGVQSLHSLVACLCQLHRKLIK